MVPQEAEQCSEDRFPFPAVDRIDEQDLIRTAATGSWAVGRGGRINRPARLVTVSETRPVRPVHAARGQ